MDDSEHLAEVEARLLRATEQAGKTYAFDEDHDVGRPADWWFQESDEGLVLFLVFYTQACRWSLCTGCNLPSVGSQHHIGWRAIIRQTDAALRNAEVAPRLPEIAKVIISNNGSVLDEETFPTTALMYLVVQLSLHLPRLRVVSFETRVEYVDLSELGFLSRAMQERAAPADIELAIGFEAFDDEIRNKVFLKGLTLRAFEELLEKIAMPHFRLKCYFMQKPVPGMSDEDAVLDVQAGIDYFDAVSKSHGVPINMHVNPTYVARGTSLAEAYEQGLYAPPLLADVARAVLHGRGKNISIYVGLNDEGLAVDGGSFLRPGDEGIAGALEAFNRSQDYAALEQACT